jgi:protein involved in polysaccharide export with SLBB domain
MLLCYLNPDGTRFLSTFQTRRILWSIALLLVCLQTPVSYAQSFADLGLDAPAAEPSAAALLGRDAEPTSTSSSVHEASRLDSNEPQPFGANLFRGGFSNDREDGLNPDYVIQPGDRIVVRIWGATEFDQELTVDARGNIFIPRVGPVTVGGTLNADLDSRVNASVRSVFTDNVRVYTSLQGAQPVAVFVTGFVPLPGRFGGIPSNSALHFIDRAGGIDPTKGSYRDITIMRDQQILERIDLYEFLLDGKQPNLQFQDGDTIVVGARGGVVTVDGDVANAAAFELKDNTIEGVELLRAAHGGVAVSHAGVSGVRHGNTFSDYLPIARFERFELEHGDAVYFRNDLQDQEIVVEIEGSYIGPSRYAVARDTRLHDLLDHIEVDRELADISAVSVRRERIKSRQKASLDQSLQRLESQYLTASSQTDVEARIRSQEAELIRAFVERARNVEPSGRLVIASESGVANVLLEAGDVITIPRRSESVLLSGEVLVAQAMLYREGFRALDYIQLSGGFSQQAERERIVVVRSNGEVVTQENPAIGPGDELIVLPRVPVKNLQLVSTIVDILYKVAIAASVAIRL